MTNVTIGETPPELAPPVLSAPDVAAELETTTPEAEAPAPADARVVPEIDPAAGVLRRAIVDHLVDTAEAGPQSVAAILSAMPAGTSRNTLESALRRSFTAGEIERTGPGQYAIGKPRPTKSAEPPPPEPDQAHRDDKADQDALERDRIRKRLARERDREQALARQAAADQELVAQLCRATGGNFLPGPGIQDVSAIKAALALGVELDIVLGAVRNKCDRILCPTNEPATSWREPRLLRAISERYCKYIVIPSMIAAMAAAGKTPQKPADASDASPAVQAPAEPDNSPAASPAHGSALPADDAEELGPSAAALMKKFGRPETPAALAANPNKIGICPVERNGVASEPPPAADVAPTRESILSAFNRRTPSQADGSSTGDSAASAICP